MRIGPQRPVNPGAIVAPQGYRVEALITGLTFPSAISFGSGGEIYLAEAGGVDGYMVAVPRVLRVDPDRSVTEIGRLDNPIMGLLYRNGELLIGEDGASPRILRVTAEGEVQILVEGLPGGGDYGLSCLKLDQSGALIFGLGTRTNSGVVGLDNVARGWVSRHPERADVPGADVRVADVNYVTSQPAGGGAARRVTGPFQPFGQRAEGGATVSGSPRCGGAIYRLPLDATEPERLAWGLRNPIGVGCSPDGRLFATEGGMEERGSRPIGGAPDNLWEIQPGGYYGWPDHASGVPVTDPRFRLPGHPQPRRLLTNAPAVTGAPVSRFAPRSGVGRFDFSTSEEFGFVGDVIVALSGAWSAGAYPSEEDGRYGHCVVRVNPRTGEIGDFLANRQGGPSSVGNSGGLERPFDVRFDPSGEVLYVVDMGEAQFSREHGLEPFGGTGVVWRITKISTSTVSTGRGRDAAADDDDDDTTGTGGAGDADDARTGVVVVGVDHDQSGVGSGGELLATPAAPGISEAPEGTVDEGGTMGDEDAQPDSTEGGSTDTPAESAEAALSLEELGTPQPAGPGDEPKPHGDPLRDEVVEGEEPSTTPAAQESSTTAGAVTEETEPTKPHGDPLREELASGAETGGEDTTPVEGADVTPADTVGSSDDAGGGSEDGETSNTATEGSETEGTGTEGAGSVGTLDEAEPQGGPDAGGISGSGTEGAGSTGILDEPDAGVADSGATDFLGHGTDGAGSPALLEEPEAGIGTDEVTRPSEGE